MTPDQPRVYIVQVLASVEVNARDLPNAKALALTEVARRCETGRELFVHAEEVKP
jgi:hypothetical protein